jgi:thiol-disulfide isomerase/thioredoxin
MATYCAAPERHTGGVADAQRCNQTTLAPAPCRRTPLEPLATVPIHGSGLSVVAKRALSTVATVVVLLTATACTSLQGTKAGTTVVTQDGGFAQIQPDNRGEPVALDGEDLRGRPLSLDTMRGKPTVVNVWGSWCGPCQKEAPLLVDAAKTLGDKANFLGIDSRDAGTAAGKTFEARNGITWPSLFSPGGEAVLAFNGLVAPRGVPTTVVLDAQGRPAGVFSGEVPSALTLVQYIEQVADGG